VIDEFILRPLLAGLGLAVAAAPVGCLTVWRRLAYFGAAVSHSALLGVAGGFLLGVDPFLGVIALCTMVALSLTALERRRSLASDTLIGILAHVTLAAGLVLLAFLPGMRLDLVGYLFGDILAVRWSDVAVIWSIALLVGGLAAWLWRGILSATVHEDLAAVEGIRVELQRILIMLMIAGVVAAGMRTVGILLIVAMLIVPAAAARAFARSPEGMVAGTALIGGLSAAGGLWLAFLLDAPAGPTIVLTAGALFGASLLWPGAKT
jgi:zinc transport system permease protein